MALGRMPREEPAVQVLVRKEGLVKVPRPGKLNERSQGVSQC